MQIRKNCDIQRCAVVILYVFSEYIMNKIFFQGTVVAKLRLAANATANIREKKRIKEMQIEDAVRKELEQRRQSWDVNNGQFEKFRQWYLDFRKDLWHRYHF